VNGARVSLAALAAKEAHTTWVLRYLCPNSAGRISVKMRSSPFRDSEWLGFSLSLQEVLDYGLFKRAATQATETPFRYEPAERDPSGAAWLALLQERTRYPDRKLTDKWGGHCPGATRFEPERRRTSVAS
jgi:hypothetical protein